LQVIFDRAGVKHEDIGVHVGEDLADVVDEIEVY
jgi:hypothetical protein